jgi:hypothetical protein
MRSFSSQAIEWILEQNVLVVEVALSKPAYRSTSRVSIPHNVQQCGTNGCAPDEMKNRKYEQLVQAIFQQLHDHDGLGDVIVEHDVVKQGKTTDHQIDVYWEFTKGGVSHRVIVQAKNWSRPVDKGEVLKFDAVLNDLPGQPRGIMVAANGYQSGAREAAAARGIAMYELNPEPPAERLTINYTGWAHLALKGYRRSAAGQPLGLVVEAEVVTPDFSCLTFHADPAWARDNGSIVPAATYLRFHPHEVEFLNGEQRMVATLREIFQKLAQAVAARGDVTSRELHSFGEATFLKLPGESPVVKITSLSVDVTIRKERQERLWSAANMAIFILKGLDDGTIRRFTQA